MFWIIGILLTLIYYIVLFKIDKKRQKAFLVEQTAMGSVEDTLFSEPRQKIEPKASEHIQKVIESAMPSNTTTNIEVESPITETKEKAIPVPENNTADLATDKEPISSIEANTTDDEKKQAVNEGNKDEVVTISAAPKEEKEAPILVSPKEPSVKTKNTTKPKTKTKSKTSNKKPNILNKKSSLPKQKKSTSKTQKPNPSISEGNNYLFEQILENQNPKIESEEVNLGASTLDDLLSDKPARHGKKKSSSSEEE